MNIAVTMPLADSWGMHGGAGWWVPMMIGMVLFWGAVVFGIFWLIRGGVRGQWGRSETPVNKESPVEILDRRFAEGAITAEDYQERRKHFVSEREVDEIKKQRIAAPTA